MNKIFTYFFSKINFVGMSFLLLILISCKSEPANKSENTRPNIVLFVADDIGWHDVGYHGSEIKTPIIDKLAETGVELNHFYVYPTCSPSRAALLTGKYASRFGIGGPIAMKSKQALPIDVETLPGALKKVGYQTALTGKWHLGLRPESGPNYYGFDHTYGYLHGQIDQYSHLYKNGDKTWHRNGEFIEEEGHATDLITKEAQKYITELRDKTKPLFLYIAYSVPHYPLQEEAKWIEPYKNLNDVDSRKVYAAATAHMDYSIGQIMKTIENQGILENTIVIFMSDNGGQENWNPKTDADIELYEGMHGPYPKLGDNTPLKGFKTELFEGGIRVPAIINWKGKLTNHKVESVFKVTDLFPTLLSLADIQIEDSIKFDGKNVSKLITDTSKIGDERTFYFRTPNQFALRKGNWKLIHFGKSLDEGEEELYNIKNDPNETKNVLKKKPELRNKLFKELQNQIRFDPKHFFE